jgi:hypothetical protein
VLVVFAAGSADRLFFQFGFGYEGAIWFFRGAFLILPVIVFALTRRICRELLREESHPLRGWSGAIVERNASGGFDAVLPPARMVIGSAEAQPDGDLASTGKREIADDSAPRV